MISPEFTFLPICIIPLNSFILHRFYDPVLYTLVYDYTVLYKSAAYTRIP